MNQYSPPLANHEGEQSAVDEEEPTAVDEGRQLAVDEEGPSAVEEGRPAAVDERKASSCDCGLFSLKKPSLKNEKIPKKT